MPVDARVARGVVELHVKVAPRQAEEGPGLEVYEHVAGKGPVRLLDGLVGQDAAGVRARAGYEAHEPVAALLRGVGRAGEQHRRRVV